MDIHRCRFVDYVPHKITATAFSSASDVNKPTPAGLHLAVGRSNGDIEIWTPEWNWTHKSTIKGGRGRTVDGLAWINGTRLFSIGGSTAVTEWSPATGEPVANYDCDSGVIWAMSGFEDQNGNGKKLALGCDNGSVVILDFQNTVFGRHTVVTLQKCNSTAQIMSLAWLDNGNMIAGGCSDGRIRVWDASKNGGRVLATMKVDTSIRNREDDASLVWALCSANGGKTLVSGDSSGSVKFWDTRSMTLAYSFPTAHEADVLCVVANGRGNQVFTGGVDRKVSAYALIGRKWASTTSRRIHGHDIRAMAVFESKNASYLVSGGVETRLIINNASQFADDRYRKLPIANQYPQVSLNGKYVMLWKDQQVKIWLLSSPETEAGQPQKRLAAKISLASDENITHAALSENLLAISTLAETKLFSVNPVNNGAVLQLEKFDLGDDIENLPGASHVLLSRNSLVMATTENGMLKYDVDHHKLVQLLPPNKPKSGDEDNNIDEDGHHGLDSDADDSEDTVCAMAVQHPLVAVSYFSGRTEIYDIKKNILAQKLLRVSAPARAMVFSSRNTLFLITAESNVVEFDLSSEEGLLTDWSRRNGDGVSALIHSPEKCLSAFFVPGDDSRLWLAGPTWLAFIKLDVELHNRKRKLNGRASTTAANSNETNDANKFWMTDRYRPVLIAGPVDSNQIAVVERPEFDLPLPPAFWSRHRLNLH